jgi:hypothetical protein
VYRTVSGIISGNHLIYQLKPRAAKAPRASDCQAAQPPHPERSAAESKEPDSRASALNNNVPRASAFSTSQLCTSLMSAH